MSKLLIDDNPLQVLPKLAEEIGLNEAIVFQQLHYWLNKSTNEHDGKRWVYNTYQQWKDDNFPFWSVQLVGNVFRSLEEKKLIISKQINRKHWDRKKWYTINYKELAVLEKRIIERIKIIPSIDQNLDSLHITETTTENTPPPSLSDEDFWQKKNEEKQAISEEEHKPLEVAGMEWKVVAGLEITKEDQAVTRGDTVDSRLSGWYELVPDTVINVIKTFSEAYGKLPPAAPKNKKDKANHFYVWRDGGEMLLNTPGNGDLLHIIKTLGKEYDGFAGIVSPKSISGQVYARMNEVKHEKEYKTNNDGMLKLG